MRVFIGLILMLLCFIVNAQISEPHVIKQKATSFSTPDTSKKTFRNSEPEGVTFIVNSNLKENIIEIKTNYKGFYKVQFIDYFAGSRKVFKNQYSDMSIDVAELERSIFIMNISDTHNKLLTSQVVNLKRRHL